MTRTIAKTSRAPSDIDRLVGEEIRKIRQDRNMTLAETGQMLGISHQQLQKYETGTNRLSAGMLWNVAELFGLPISAFFPDGDEVEDATLELARLRRKVDRARQLLESDRAC
ncbi:helix-turn-helix domain-containing protein [Hyphomonas sp. UBA4494]|jgi:transcriptional regulator with XRE-family HTH domain|uniref:helix-turn-helix domain-containing protein n=1 Tax=Hyphomonas sp. UBA4494 TaxID=1946631 RepID=UPI0025B93F3D|nr:helix-turn-helix transcriptional regulator [Hyphomonas sp. UBA4494]